MGPQVLIICKKCQRVLSNVLVQVEKNFKAEFLDCWNVVPKNKYWVGDSLTNESSRGNVFIHHDDAVGLIPHPDAKRHQGCCGADGHYGPNLLCECGVEIATKVDDCWTSYYTFYEKDKIEIIAPNTS